MSLFKNKYRIESARLAGHDYSTSGLYFVTICTKGMNSYFGEIKDFEMHLNDCGTIVTEEWNKTTVLRSNLELDEFIVMPNHIHGIIVIIQQHVTKSSGTVETHSNASLHSPQRFGPQRHNLGSIVRGFKGATTKRIHESGCKDFAWQPRFYDHVIRNERALQKIREYIQNNPARWEVEKNDSAEFLKIIRGV